MVKKPVIRDELLKLLARKTGSWSHKHFHETTKTKLTPMPKEIHSSAALFTITNDKYSIRNGFLQQIEIIPPTTYNLIAVESRIGNREGTGYAVKTQEIEQGNPTKISFDSLEQSLERLYKKARVESNESFIECFNFSNTYHFRRYLEDIVITTPIGKRKRIEFHTVKKNGEETEAPRFDLFYHLYPTKQVRYVQGNSEQREPGPKIQHILTQVSKELVGDNKIDENGFEALAEINVINETERIANSEGSMLRASFSGYWVVYKISFHSPIAGECLIEWNFGIDSPTITKQHREYLNKKAGELNQSYNEFFNNEKATTIPTGKWEVYLEPENTAVQIHEAIAHASSSDLLTEHLKFPNDEDRTENTFTIEDFNTQVGNPNLQIIANPRKKRRNGILYWGGYNFDHEAVEAQKFPIIKNGILAGLIADRNDAYILNQIFEHDFVKPGSSRFGITEGSEIGFQAPRVPNLEVRWSENLSREELWERFLDRVKKFGRTINYKNKRRKAGLWFKGGPHGEYTREGLSKEFFNLAYLVFENGEYIPIRDMLYTSNSPRIILGNVQGVASKREHIMGRCGLGDKDYDYRVRESIFCGPSIISDFEVKKVSQLLRRYEE